MKRLMIIDLMNMAFRSYWGYAKKGYLSHNGKPTFMCYGTAITLNRLLRDYKPDYVVVCADGGGETFRHRMYTEYKSNRKPAPEDFISQLPDLYRMFDAFGIKVVRVPGVEADDLIGTVATTFPSEFREMEFTRGVDDRLETYIVSGDKDFMQLVKDDVFLVRQAAEGYETFGAEAVALKFGCKPEQVVDALAIIGDAVDMVPGVEGIGEKGAAQLVAAFGSLEKIYENLAFIKPALANKLAKSRDMAFLSKKLVTIDLAAPVSLKITDCAVPTDILRREELVKFYTELSFKSLIMASEIDGQIPDKFLSTFGDLP